MKRILICIPVYGYPMQECIESIINLITICKNKYDIKIKFINDYTVDFARNKAFTFFLTTECDYLLFIDSDIIINEVILEKLLKADKDIISAVYNKKTVEIHETTISYIENDEWKTYKTNEIKNELFEADAFGFGCVLLKRDVVREMFEKLKGICFRFVQSTITISEDLYFCLECKKAGYSLWVDGTAKVGHIGKFIY